MTEDDVVGWHHQLDGHEFEQALGVGDGQGNLVCCSPWGRKESDTTERLNSTSLQHDNYASKTLCFKGKVVMEVNHSSCQKLSTDHF